MNDKLRLSIWRNSFIIREKNRDMFFQLEKKPLLFRNFLTNQIGGGKKLKVTYEDKEYVFEEAMDKNYYILWSIEEFECVTVVIDKDNGNAEIHNVGNYESCLATTNTNIGSTLLRITIAMLKKYKEKLNVRRIVLTDNSIKKCNNKNIILSTMMILLTGDTWYGRYKFVPTEERFVKKYNNNKKIINSTKLEDIDLIKYLNKTKMSKELLQLSHKFINKHPQMLLKDYLTKLITNFDKTCEYFYDFYEELFDDLGLYDFRGRTFVLHI
jgi:hypothetical protein